ncbi:hypothetical protein DRP04_08195 [Archaeoglobales archaeon]|nr:MAG: hypothetical protein DRP04_08195 [Archaeoglobales archaeon]
MLGKLKRGFLEDERGIVFTLMVLFLFFVAFGILFLLVYPIFNQVSDVSVQMGTPQDQVEAIDRGYKFIPIALVMGISFAGFIAALAYEIWWRS